MSYAEMAKHVMSRGRGQDTMLVHMTPDEVGGLHNLAKAAGGSLTTNPHTGLPEAGFLSGLLPFLGGALLDVATGGAATPYTLGMSPALFGAGAATAIDTAITGSLSKGLMAGLGAFGGASMAGGVMGAMGSGASAATPGVTGAAFSPTAQGTMAGMADTTAATGAATGAATDATAVGNSLGEYGSSFGPIPAAAPAAPTSLLPGAATNAANAANTGSQGFLQSFSNTAKQGLSGSLAKYAPYAAGLGTLSSLSQAFQGTGSGAPQQQVPVYGGPYHFAPRATGASPNLVMGPNGVYQAPTSEPLYFNPTTTLLGANNQPYVYETAPISSINQYGGTNLPGYASGGPINQPSTPNQTVPQPAAETVADASNPQFSAAAPQTNVPHFQAPSMQMMAQPASSPVSGQVGNDPNGLSQIRGLPAISGYAAGGKLPIKDGSFIVDARTVSELGNGSSRAGQDLLAKHGGHPISGPGDGVSDSIPANIGGTQRARVARDEVKFDPEAVARIGKGDHSAGTKKLYALMDKAEKARKKAKRGQDTGLRKGLA